MSSKSTFPWRQWYKNRSSRKIDSQRLLSRESDFQKTFSLTENQFSGKTYFHTIHPWLVELLGAEGDGVGADLVDDAAALDDALGAHQDAVHVGHDVPHGGVEDRREGESQLAQGLL